MIDEALLRPGRLEVKLTIEFRLIIVGIRFESVGIESDVRLTSSLD